MPYSETIDNINNRIENVISDRLPQTYQHIVIEPSDYNPTIDDTITVTITVTDQSDTPVTGFTVPLKVNNESITGLVTNSSGQVVYNYSCDDWGTIKFAVKSYTAFINVTGWRTVQSNVTYTLYVDESTRTCRVRATRSNVTIINGESFTYNDFVIPEKYRPIDTSVVPCFRANSEVFHYVFNSGIVGIYNSGNTKTGWNLGFIHEWHY